MKRLGVVNGFELKEKERKDSNNKDVIVKFLVSGTKFTQSSFYDVTPENVERMRRELLDWTEYNLRVETQTQAITLLDMISTLYEIV